MPPRRDRGQYVFEIESCAEAGDDLRQLDARAVGDLAPVGGEGTAGAGEPDPLVECRHEQRRVPSVGVPKGRNSTRVHVRSLNQDRDGGHCVLDDLPHQRVAGDEPIRKCVVVLVPVVVTRIGPWTARSPVLEGDRVGGKHDEPGPGERWTEGLVPVPNQSEDLRLAEVALSCVLVKDNDTREGAVSAWHGQESWDDVIVGDEMNEVSHVPVVLPRRDQADLRGRPQRLNPQERPELSSEGVWIVELRWQERDHGYHEVLHIAAETTERLLSVVLLVLLGGAIVDGVLSPLVVAWRRRGLLIVLVVRPLAGLVSLARTRTQRGERTAIAFFGVRGVGSIYYLAHALNSSDFADGPTVWALVAFVVVVSVVLHGITALPVMGHLDDRRAATAADP